jgi:hypothetical protein
MLACVFDMQHNRSAWQRDTYASFQDVQQRLMPRALPAREYRKEDGADSGPRGPAMAGLSGLIVWLKMKPVFTTG